MAFSLSPPPPPLSQDLSPVVCSRSPRRPPRTTRSRRSDSTRTSSYSPPRTRARSRGRSEAVRDSCDNAVYLIDKGATGVAAASDRSNQVKFMQIMGLVGEDATISEGQEHAPPFPVDDEQLKLLQTAMDHDLHPCYQVRGTCDGYYTPDQLDECISGSEPQQCQCSAHAALFSGTLTDDQMEDLKDLIRSPSRIKNLEEGNSFVLALLRRLVYLFRMPGVRVSAAGRSNGVNYILVHQNKTTPSVGILTL